MRVCVHANIPIRTAHACTVTTKATTTAGSSSSARPSLKSTGTVGRCMCCVMLHGGISTCMCYPNGCMPTEASTARSTSAASSTQCPKCGLGKQSGKRSCCFRGGAWFKKCGAAGDSQLEHTWVEGIQACKSTSFTMRGLGHEKRRLLDIGFSMCVYVMIASLTAY